MAQWSDEGTNMTIALASLGAAQRNTAAVKITYVQTEMKLAVVSRPAYSLATLPSDPAGETEQSVVF